MSNENINTAGAAIAEALAEYDQEIADATKRITDEVAKEAVDTLKKSSPKLTGSYRKGWRKKQHTQTNELSEILYITRQTTS